MTSEQSSRMADPESPPSDREIADLIGEERYRYWKQTVAFIDRAYPDVFRPEWLFGGKKHGWSLRYKKSKSFCTLIPEKNRYALLLVFGAEERTKVEDIKASLSPYTTNEYDKAATYHDGKWLFLTIDSAIVLEDAFSLLAVKRKPKAKRT
jgi:hypothetical protein